MVAIQPNWPLGALSVWGFLPVRYGKGCLTPKACRRGVHLLYLGLQPGDVTHGQGKATPMVTFPPVSLWPVRIYTAW